MRENKYDDRVFFEKYSQMARSRKGLEAAGEWHYLKKMLPDFGGKRVLDLGCGFGWHCQYALEQGASNVVGVDISESMLGEARKKFDSPLIEYICAPIEDVEFPEGAFDAVISSLAFHYIKSFEDICKKVSSWLVRGGDFVFSVEHPIFTAYGDQCWFVDEKGKILHWPVDNYFTEGVREAIFLGEKVIKYHKTLSSYINTLIDNGFEIRNVAEPQPDEYLLKAIPEMKDELRRPMILIVSAHKK